LHRIYGFHRISLAKLAAHGDGWKSMTYQCRGSMVTREYKSFLATSRLVSGVIHVVILRFDDGGWAAYFCTDAQVNVRDILETVAARWSIEEPAKFLLDNSKPSVCAGHNYPSQPAKHLPKAQ